MQSYKHLVLKVMGFSVSTILGVNDLLVMESLSSIVLVLIIWHLHGYKAADRVFPPYYEYLG